MKHHEVFGANTWINGPALNDAQAPRLSQQLVRPPGRVLESTSPLEDQRVTLPVAPAAWHAIKRPDVYLSPSPSRVTFELLQRWEGTVQVVRDDDVDAILVDKTNGSFEDETVTLALEDFSLDDRPLVVPGAVFYWTIGYRTEAGTRRRESFFALRRRPSLTRALPLAKKEAKIWSELFGKPSEP